MVAPQRPAKRAKIAVACQRCRVRKVRCDGTRPTCLQCMIGQTDCSWPSEGSTSVTDGASYNKAPINPSGHDDFSMQIPAAPSALANQTPSMPSDFTPANVPLTPFGYEAGQQHTQFNGPAPPQNFSPPDNSHVEDFNSLQWMMNQLSGSAAYESEQSALQPSPSNSNTSADTGSQSARRQRSSSTLQKLSNLSWQELYSRVYGTYARYLVDVNTTPTANGHEDLRSSSIAGSMNELHRYQQPDQKALSDAAHALAIRFQGLEDADSHNLQRPQLQKCIDDTLQHVGAILRHPTQHGILALAMISWLLYMESEVQTSFSFCTIAASQCALLPESLQTQAGINSGAWVLYDLIGEMILRSGTHTSDLWLDLHQKAFVTQDDSDDTSALISAGIAVQSAAVGIHQLVSLAAREHGTSTHQSELDLNLTSSQHAKPILQEIANIYAKLDLPFAILTSDRLSQLDDIEQGASQAYEALSASALFSVSNFTQHDQTGHGAVFLALHVKYEAMMCFIYQLRAYSLDDEQERRDAIATSASAARSLADDLVVAEAMAPWAIAANPSLDRYIFLGALSILISFKITTGSFKISKKSSKSDGHTPGSNSTSRSDSSTRTRLLCNVLRQNFTACHQALKLLSRFCLATNTFLDLLDGITKEEHV